MTLQQLRFIVDLEQTGSITKSAANMYLSQPNLSTALKALEEEIGTTIFLRSSKGVEVTAEGLEFLSYAKSVLAQIDKMEFVFKNSQNATALVVACIRSSYMARIFCDLYNQLPKDAAIQLSLFETTLDGVFDAIANSRADIGKLSFAENEYHKMRSKAVKSRIVMELMWKVRPYVLTSAKSPLARVERLTPDMLESYTHVLYGDFEYDSVWHSEAVDFYAKRRIINVCDRASMMDALSSCHDCYIWTTSTHPDILRMYDLTAIPCDCAGHVIEAIIYPKDRPRSKEAQWLIEAYRSLRFSEYFLNQEPFQPQTIL